eukprot:CAMPEP_0206185462 /NCGR_PEP_ID=MMETSP0166-20121206/1824_1 /ASSEMBLY_ACC=CAM_ASM_000260 /TAXON_ID=95228 /ORGANISM="Vannella robusta, Strain DIVA3 518/3/11/1/6" /LENGTH=706 /DNA_ID=CAMNT_0053600665 /DNA_START=1612 /DNA_END=3732 /DNA_ORIENTATION=-
MRSRCSKIAQGPLIQLLSVEEDAIQELASIAIENMAFDHASNLGEAVLPLLKLTESSNDAVVINALRALLNFCSVGPSMESIMQNGFPSLLNALSKDSPVVKTHAMHLIAATLAETLATDFKEKDTLISSLKPLLVSNSDYLLHAVYVLSKFCKTESNQKVTANSELMSSINKQMLEQECPTILEFTLAIFESCVKFCKQEKRTEYLGKESIERCVALLSTVNILQREYSIKILFQCSGIEHNKPFFDDTTRSTLYDCMASPLEVIRTTASKTLLNLVQNEDKTISVPNLRSLAKLLNSWSNVSGDKPINGLSVKIEDSKLVQLQSECTNVLTMSHPSEESMVNTTARSLAIPTETAIRTSMSLAVPDSSSKKKKNRKSSGKAGSRGFVIGTRSRLPRSRASTIGVNREHSESSDDSQPKKKGHTLHKYQISTLARYHAAVEDRFAQSRISLSRLFSVELVKHVNPMQDLSFPMLADFSLREQGEESLLKIATKETGYIVEYSSKTEPFYPVLEAVQSKHPFSQSLSICYFELFILSAGKSGTIGMGITTENYPLDQQPGWCDGGWGYHADDGNKYWYEEGECHNEQFGPCYGTGDIIGCGINNVTSQVFFTKNGFVVDTAFNDIPTNSQKLHPFVCLGSRGEKVFVNFGQTPFLWNFDIEHTLNETAAPKAEYEQTPPKAKREPIRMYESALQSILRAHPFVSLD